MHDQRLVPTRDIWYFPSRGWDRSRILEPEASGQRENKTTRRKGGVALATNQRTRLGGYNLTTLGVVAICFVTIVFDGYDLIVYGAVVPALLEYREWDLTAVEAGAIGSYALIGM